MIKLLLADGPDKELKAKLQFGQFIGNWQIHSTWYLKNGIQFEGEGEVSFRWILYGTAIQDVWTGDPINPPKGFPKKVFVTTIRYYDKTIDAWKCIWIAPASTITSVFIARKKGEKIVLEGTNKEENKENWIYSKINPESFDWRAEISKDNRKTWDVEQIIKSVRQLEEYVS